MDSFSSSFFSTVPKHTKITPTLTSNLYLLNVSNVRIEDTPPQATTTARPPPSPPLKKQSKKTQNSLTKRPVESSLPNKIFNAFDDYINNVVDPPNRPWLDPKIVLSNNFSPVSELPPTECEVLEGSLPSCLDGAYFRNGPNPQYFPHGPYHLFDGDGMLHSIRISQGKAIFCCRFVNTYKYKIEREIGFPVFPSLFSGLNSLAAAVARGALTVARIAAGQLNFENGVGQANTSLALFGGKLYALYEADLPYAIKLAPNGDIVTLGRHDFDGKLVMSMTAHPKIDPETGEAFAFKYGPMHPFWTYFRISPDGTKQPDVPIFSLKSPSFLHDFSITKKYAIFPETQLRMNRFVEIIAQGSIVGADLSIVPRLGVIPRYAKDESQMRWFKVPGLNMVHTINSWDEDDGDSIVLVAPNILPVEHTLERIDLIHASIEKVKIDLKTGNVRRFPVSTRNLDFGVINPAYVGKKNKYVYAGIGDPFPRVSGVVKLDLSVSEGDRPDCIVASRLFGAGCFAGEPFFVAKYPDNQDADEDDGYILTYLHNENTGESKFLVMDAKSPNLEIVVAVKLPQRVPSGFHGLFVRERDLKKL